MIRAAWHYLRQQGFRTAAWRAKYVIARKTGSWKRRFPEYQWSERPLSYWTKQDVLTTPAEFRRARASSPARYFFPLGELPDVNRDWLVADVKVADEILAGRFTYFSWQKGDLGNPPDWLLNPFTGMRFDDRHWCDRGDFDPKLGDIKYVWEPSRFGWVYALVRAYAATRDEKYVAGFWRWWESWCAGNPPQRGPNWQCGQECALRVMACTFALHAFWKSPETSDDRIARMAAYLAAHAERIAGNIDFARSINNNHTVSEALGLYTVGLLFPEFREAANWFATGKRILEIECLGQFYSDGAYLQHSFNYQRLVIQAYAWVLALAKVNDDPLNPALLAALDRCVQFMWHVQEETNGRVPNYGNNDGALILPLDSCGYLDYRPALNLLHYALHRECLYDPGPWDEPIAWLFSSDHAPLSPPFTKGGLGGGGTSLTLPIQKNLHQSSLIQAEGQHANTIRKSLHAADGGYYTLRGKESWAMVRCHTYRHRPVQADMLHVDLWWRGLNILRDAGTYSYNCPEPWLGYFQGTSAHNTVVVDERDQMEKGERFMWYGWTKAKCECHAQFLQGQIEYWEGGLIHKKANSATQIRTVTRFADEQWAIIDIILGTGAYELFWHLSDDDWQLHAKGAYAHTKEGIVKITVLGMVEEVDLMSGITADRPQGWKSLYYGTKSPQPTLRVKGVIRGDTRLATIITLGADQNVEYDFNEKRLAWGVEPTGLNHELTFNPDDLQLRMPSVTRFCFNKEIFDYYTYGSHNAPTSEFWPKRKRNS